MPLSFEEKLANYAELIVRVGIDVQPGQRLVIQAPIGATAFVRRVAASAYEAGAPLVEVLWDDEALQLVRLEHAPEGSLGDVAEWAVEAKRRALERGDALLTVDGRDPDLFARQDSGRVAAMRRALRQANRGVLEQVMQNAIAWCVAAVPVQPWADKVFPELPPGERLERLWGAVFAATRADLPEPVAAWREHLRALEARRDSLNRKCYQELVFRGPGTDMRVGLPDGHCWAAGTSTSRRGVVFAPNIPTEEVFTLPHRERTEGVVTSTKPLSYNGTLIEDFSLRFAGGRVVWAGARQGEGALRALLSTDEGAARLGEVALVPHGSPVAGTGLLFYNTLFDENAASHLALGRAYRFTIEGGEEMSEQAAMAAGVNESLEHVDFMVGSERLDVDGVTENGTVEPVMRAGEWVL